MKFSLLILGFVAYAAAATVPAPIASAPFALPLTGTKPVAAPSTVSKPVAAPSTVSKPVAAPSTEGLDSCYAPTYYPSAPTYYYPQQPTYYYPPAPAPYYPPAPAPYYPPAPATGIAPTPAQILAAYQQLAATNLPAATTLLQQMTAVLNASTYNTPTPPSPYPAPAPVTNPAALTPAQILAAYTSLVATNPQAAAQLLGQMANALTAAIPATGK